MAKVEFQYNGEITMIQCKENQKMAEICDNFISKYHINENEIYYFYNGTGGAEFNKNLTFNQMANAIDKKRKKMNVLVYNIDDEIKDKNMIIRPKNIICPKCKEDIKMKIDNYKINLFECKNKHKINNILLNELKNKQMLNLMDIKCGLCKEANKFNTYNKEFYQCDECNINICPLCKINHNKNYNDHNIYNIDTIHYKCNKHDEKYIYYCKECYKNICSLCNKKHLNHSRISISDMILDKNELLRKLDQLKKFVDIFNDNINIILEIINIAKENINYFYELEEYMINNYDEKERNYEILYNLKEVINYNNKIINDINEINNNNNIQNKFNNIFNIYNTINNNEIQMTIKINKDDIGKKIYFLDNTNGNIVVDIDDNLNFKKEEHHHDLLKMLNESNVQLYINDKKYKYEKYFIPEKEGLYKILLKFNINMKDCRFMFYDCNNIINIDLSSFNTKMTTNMASMFDGCLNLENINLSSFNTENVTNMLGMFGQCGNLINIDLSSFNTEKVTNMAGMFGQCSKLKNIDVSTFNTQNVTNMAYMFMKCSNLTSINLSSFNTQKTHILSHILEGCSKLEGIKIKKDLGAKIANEVNKKIKIIFS